MITRKEHEILTDGMCDCFRIAYENRENEMLVELYNRFVRTIEDTFNKKVEILDVEGRKIFIRDKQLNDCHEDLPVKNIAIETIPIPQTASDLKKKRKSSADFGDMNEILKDV